MVDQRLRECRALALLIGERRVAGKGVRRLLNPLEDADALNAEQNHLNRVVGLWLDLLDLRQRPDGIGARLTSLFRLGVTHPADEEPAVGALRLADRSQRRFAARHKIDGAARAGKNDSILEQYQRRRLGRF